MSDPVIIVTALFAIIVQQNDVGFCLSAKLIKS